MEKFIKQNWLWIMIIFTLFVMFGTIRVKIETFNNQDNPWSTCPKTQNCSKGPITHQTDKIALEIEKEQYLKKIEELKKYIAKYEAEIAVISSTGTDNMGLNIELKNRIEQLNREIKKYKDQISELDNLVKTKKDIINNLEKLYKKTDKERKDALDQAKLCKTADMNLDKKYQKVVKENTNIKNQLKQPVYARLSNHKYGKYSVSETISLKECQDMCSKDNDCTAINYFTKPTGLCNVIKQLNYCDIVDAENDEDFSIYFRGFRDSTSDINQVNLVKSSLTTAPVQSVAVKQESAAVKEKKVKLMQEIKKIKNLIKIYENMSFGIGFTMAEINKKRLKKLEEELKALN